MSPPAVMSRRSPRHRRSITRLRSPPVLFPRQLLLPQRGIYGPTRTFTICSVPSIKYYPESVARLCALHGGRTRDPLSLDGILHQVWGEETDAGGGSVVSVNVGLTAGDVVMASSPPPATSNFDFFFLYAPCTYDKRMILKTPEYNSLFCIHCSVQVPLHQARE